MAGRGPPETSPVRNGEPLSVPSEAKFRSWSNAACDTRGPGTKLKSSDPDVPAMELVSTLTGYRFPARTTDATPISSVMERTILCRMLDTPYIRDRCEIDSCG